MRRRNGAERRQTWRRTSAQPGGAPQKAVTMHAEQTLQDGRNASPLSSLKGTLVIRVVLPTARVVGVW
jgi:hypothetical protein